MRKVFRRIFSAGLALVILVSTGVTSFGATPSGATDGNWYNPGNWPAYGKNPTPPNDHWGVRLSVTNMTQAGASNITPIELGESYTSAVNQFNDLAAILTKKVWQPGNYGIVICDDDSSPYAIVDPVTMATDQVATIKARPGRTYTQNDNWLAWNVYQPGWKTQRPDPDDSVGLATSYNEDIYNIFLGPEGKAAAAADAMAWVHNVREAYKQAHGDRNFSDMFAEMFGDGTHLVESFQMFSWASITPSGDPMYEGNASAHIMWSHIGMKSAIMQYIWACEDAGDTRSAQSAAVLLQQWVINGDPDSACALVAESVVPALLNGTQVWYTVGACFQYAYPDTSYARMYIGWDDAVTTMGDAFNKLYGGHSTPDTTRTALIRWILGSHFVNGVWTRAGSIGSSKTFSPGTFMSAVAGMQLHGYSIHWPLYATSPDSPGTPGKPSTQDPPGKFTWKLTPNGTIDKTPDKEIKAPSTITDLNISQNGWNYNNYAKWEQLIRGDSKDSNRMRIYIYHISQALPTDTKATRYQRDQVKAGGTAVTTSVDRVTPGDGMIRNIPVITELANGVESRDLTDDEMLTILKTATGMTYTETIEGPLVNGDTPNGVRVSYAIYVDVNPGGTGWRAFENDQAEYVEYRSEPGTYTWISDDPDGYAEIKCGYFDSTKYTEPFEAMAGSPTTENLYFTSGGQEFVAQIKYQYTTDKTAIRSFEQKYTTETCAGYYSSGQFYTTGDQPDNGLHQAEINTCVDWKTHVDGVNSKKCSECGYEHYAGASKNEPAYPTKYSQEGGVGTEFTTPSGLWEVYDIKEVAWDWVSEGWDVDHTHEEPDGEGGTTTVEDCDGAETLNESDKTAAEIATIDPTSCSEGRVGSWEKVKATRWTFKIRANHKDFNSGATSTSGDKATTQLTSSIKFEQDYTNMNYAKIKEAHVWRLEKSRMEGIRQLTFEADDSILATAEELSNVVFNVAEADNAKEGRMYYALHPTNGDNFVFTATLKTRGCCACHNHCAAEDLIDSVENPNNQYEEAWCVSDYLVLEGTRATTSLLYYEYQTMNKANSYRPIMRIKVSGRDGASRQDNGYTITRAESGDEFRGFDVKGKVFKTEPISYNVYTNATYGTEEKVCQNPETYYGGNVESDDICWGGYNGKGASWNNTTVAAGTDDPSVVTKYRGLGGNNNWLGKGDKKVFKTGYTHNDQGETGGFKTSSPQKLTNPSIPFVLTYNDIDVHDVKVHNGRKTFKNSTIFYNNIISYGGGALWSEDPDTTYNMNGFKRSTDYSDRSSGINDIVIHNPVSSQFAKLIPLPQDLDQRVDTELVIDSLNKDNGKCPGKANACQYAHINCEYNGTRYHNDKCYVEVRGTGLATVPVTGTTTTVMTPVTTTQKVSGSKQFGYTGGRQTFVAPETGRYTFNVWGAQGGTASNGGAGGQGGHTWGDVYLTKGQTVYIYVGGAGGTGYNSGGYNGGGGGANDGGGGGGMSSISVDAGSAAAPSNNRGTTGPYLCFGEPCMATGKHNRSKCPYGHSCSGCVTCHTCVNGNYRKPVTLWNSSKGYILIAGGGGGAGNRNGGAGGGSVGSTGTKGFGYPGTGGTQSAGGSGGTNYGLNGVAGCGGSNTVTARSGGGGGGGGWFGGGAGGNDYSRYRDVDDSGGGGGSGFINGGSTNGQKWVLNGGSSNGGRSGHGLVTVSYTINKEVITYVPVVSGNYTYDRSQADVIPVELKPHIYTAPENGTYSVHLYGAAGGGSGKGQASAGGLGGYAAGQIYLTKGQRILVTVGGVGSNAATVGEQRSGGYNGGGNGASGSGGSFGGGGATDIALNFTYQTANDIAAKASGAVVRNGMADLTASGAFYWGPRITSYTGHVYRVDYYGENLDKAKFDSLAYTQNWASNTLNNATLLHSYITSEHAQLFWRVNTPSIVTGQEFRVHGNGAARLREVYVVDMNDRLMVAGAGGGADNAGGTLNGSDDGRGGAGGGLTGEDGYTNGVRNSANKGAQASYGHAQGIGQDATSGTDEGAGGAGWYGGYKGSTSNSGGGGGSSNIGKMQNSITKVGQNAGAGYAIFVKPGKGETENTHKLSCAEPHHAPNSNWHRYTDGWLHEGGFTCTGVGCRYCANKVDIYSPTGHRFTIDDLNNRAYIIQHDGQLMLTDGNDAHCDECNQDVTFDSYTLDNKNNKLCAWKATGYDAACYSTVGATNPEYHYAFGDNTCYDPCLNDDNHKKKHDEAADAGPQEKAGQFVVLDYDFEVYFPNRGDFYGNGALGLRNPQKPEGWGYIDYMDTTTWLKEKYVVFPFDVTYKGKTFLSGEKVMLGTYDEATYTWHDDDPVDYKYTFHCLLSNREKAAASIQFVARAKNCEYPDILENHDEDHNYTRYGDAIRAYHDSEKSYFIDVIGRIGVLSIEDTGDFRFSNYYKQTTDGWAVDQVVRNVDLSKQNFVSIDQKTIFNDNISTATKGQNTWGLTDWMEPIDKLRAFPLTPGENNVKALKNQAHRIGYSDYMSLVTVGNYYGENTTYDPDRYKTQIQPYYYYYNLETKEWVPMDVYIKDGDTYKLINKYGSADSTADYNFYYNLNWETEYGRRMYTRPEEDATKAVQEAWFQAVDNTAEGSLDHMNNIQIPHGIKYLHGTANMLFLRDRNRTFIGTRNRYGTNTEEDGRVASVNFNRQAQRWHFTLGLPSTSAFVRKGEPCTPENIAKYDMDKGVIICALDILAKGDVWTLHYDGVPVGERSFYLFDNNTTLVSWETAGANGPEDKQVVVVYTDAKTSRHDLTTEGTH